MSYEPGEVTRLLKAVHEKEPGSHSKLFDLVVEELRKIAKGKLRTLPRSANLGATELVNEVYCRLFGNEQTCEWSHRRHFYCTAAKAMRFAIIDHSRKLRTERRGGGVHHVPLDEGAVYPREEDPLEFLVIEEALVRLEQARPRAMEVFSLEYFAGLVHREVAAALDISESTVKREWDFARGFILDAIDPDSSNS